MTGQPPRDPGDRRQRAFNGKRLNASKAASSPPAAAVVRRCGCGALACYGRGRADPVWYCAGCVPAVFWDHKRRAEGEAVAAAARPAGPPAKQGSLKL